MSDQNHDNQKDQSTSGTSRRGFLKGVAAASTIIAAPSFWVPNRAFSQTVARGSVKHVIFIRLSGGFRFTAAFNGDVAARYNPFGLADNVSANTKWGVSRLLEQSNWLNADREALGMKSVMSLTDQIAVLPCVDHEPTSGSADGNHATGYERYLTGYVGGSTSVLTMINYGLRDIQLEALNKGEILLPAFSLGSTGMAKGAGKFAAYRPPVISNSFDQFGFDASTSLPDWAQDMAKKQDERARDARHPDLRAPLDAYMQTRDATGRYNAVFNSDLLKINSNADEAVDGVTNAQLRQMFGDSAHARRLRLALRLFHFGCPAVYLNQGGYDMHSGEEQGLPNKIAELNHMISALIAALKLMDHPAGGKYWDHTLVALGSEFGRTTRGNKFNSARGSDHGGDLATRWMSMPVFGGVIEQAGNGGKTFGLTRAEDLKAEGKVYSYRALCKTLMDTLGCEHSEFFPADQPFDDLFV